MGVVRHYVYSGWVSPRSEEVVSQRESSKMIIRQKSLSRSCYIDMSLVDPVLETDLS
jgi:hypothetical protein